MVKYLKFEAPASQVAEGPLRSEASEPRFQRAKRGERNPKYETNSKIQNSNVQKKF